MNNKKGNKFSNSAVKGGLCVSCHWIFVLFAMAAIMPAAAGVEAEAVIDENLVNAGPVVDATDVFLSGSGLTEFTANELPMFYKDLDDANFDPENMGESLAIQLSNENEIAAGGLMYTSRAWTDKNGRQNIAWLGEKYLAVGGDVSKLAEYLVDFTPSENLTLMQGDVWNIGEGMTLAVQEIDVIGAKVWLVLEQDGSQKGDIIVEEGGYGYYNTTVADESDVTVVMVHVDKVLAGMSADMAIIDDAEIISFNVTELNLDEYFGMRLTLSSNYLQLREEDATSISRGKTVEIIPDFLTIRVGDTGFDEPVRFYLFCEIAASELYKQQGPIIDSTAEAPASIIFNANDLPMFYKDLDEIDFDPENNRGESLTIQLSDEDEIAADGLIYTSRSWTDKNGRLNIAWLGEKYHAVGDDVTKLTKYLVDFTSSENLTLVRGDVWEIGDGYTLEIMDFDLNGPQVWMVMKQDGIPIDDMVVQEGEYGYYYATIAGVTDVLVARIHVDTILLDTYTIILDDAQIISPNVIELVDDYFGMAFSSGPRYLQLREESGKSISRGKILEIIPNFLSIRAGDTQVDEPVRFNVLAAASQAPEITIFAPSSPVSDIAGAARSFKITVDQNVNVTWYLEGTPIQFEKSAKESIYTNTSASTGTWNVTAVAENNNGTDMKEFIWVVTPRPIALIAEPEESAYVKGTINISGTADATNLKNYRVEWKNTTGEWIEIQNSTESVNDGILATWDTTTMEAGIYVIRLTVTDNASSVNETEVNVTIDNTPPEVRIIEPEPDSSLLFFENFVKGEVSDDNFDSARLIVKSEAGVMIGSYDLDITDNRFATRVEFAPDQNNTLELIAVDRADNSNRTDITVRAGNNTYQNTTDVIENEPVAINAIDEAGTEIECYPNITADNITFTVTAITAETQINDLNNSIFSASGEMAVGRIIEINVTGLDAMNESEVQNITLYLHYTKADLDLDGDGTLEPGDLDEDNLFIYWFNATRGNWTKLLKASPDWVIDNGQVKISGDAPGKVWVKLKHLSMFALAALPEPQPTHNGGDDSNGGGGSGGGASGENLRNIECFEIDRQYVSKDSSVSYNFSNECNVVAHFNFRALTSSGTVVGKVEMLKNTSTLVDVVPPNIVYKNFNIWVGYAGWATERNIEEVTITFAVNKSWVQTYNIDTGLITLNRYGNGNWIQLPTKRTGEKDGLLIFSASTSPDGFGSFAVTGVRIGGEPDVTATSVATSMATPSEVPVTEPSQKPAYKTWLILGVVLLLLAMAYLKKDQISMWLKERRP